MSSSERNCTATMKPCAATHAHGDDSTRSCRGRVAAPPRMIVTSSHKTGRPPTGTAHVAAGVGADGQEDGHVERLEEEQHKQVHGGADCQRLLYAPGGPRAACGQHESKGRHEGWQAGGAPRVRGARKPAHTSAAPRVCAKACQVASKRRSLRCSSHAVQPRATPCHLGRPLPTHTSPASAAAGGAPPPPPSTSPTPLPSTTWTSLMSCDHRSTAHQQCSLLNPLQAGRPATVAPGSRHQRNEAALQSASNQKRPETDEALPTTQHSRAAPGAAAAAEQRASRRRASRRRASRRRPGRAAGGCAPAARPAAAPRRPPPCLTARRRRRATRKRRRRRPRRARWACWCW